MTSPAENQRRIAQAAAWLLEGQSTQHVVTRLLHTESAAGVSVPLPSTGAESNTPVLKKKRSIIKTYLPRGPQALSKFLVLPNQTETSHQVEQAP